MQITWYGHAAFLIQIDGRRLIMDPYSSECGYRPIDDRADIVAISHENQKYHSCLDTIHGEFELVRGLEIPPAGMLVQGIPFSAMEVYEDAQGTGPNAMVSFTAEGLRVSHLGDLGHALNDRQLDFLSGTDILLALTGGPPTIELPDLMRVVESVQPAVTIPMHYRTPSIDLNLQPVEDIIALFDIDRVIHHPRPTWEVSHNSLPAPGTLVVLPPGR